VGAEGAPIPSDLLSEINGYIERNELQAESQQWRVNYEKAQKELIEVQTKSHNELKKVQAELASERDNAQSQLGTLQSEHSELVAQVETLKAQLTDANTERLEQKSLQSQLMKMLAERDNALSQQRKESEESRIKSAPLQPQLVNYGIIVLLLAAIVAIVLYTGSPGQETVCDMLPGLNSDDVPALP